MTDSKGRCCLSTDGIQKPQSVAVKTFVVPVSSLMRASSRASSSSACSGALLGPRTLSDSDSGVKLCRSQPTVLGWPVALRDIHTRWPWNRNMCVPIAGTASNLATPVCP
eukprot:Amastigsp_a844249_36.p3 type:complete len:110 gc:universal Amastigsp_a844249_36:438-767(+)